MNAVFPDTDTLQAVLTLATRAPSIHNTQPWRWRVDTASLDLYSEPNMQLQNTDPDGRDLILSCGTALHHCVVALAAMGWKAKVHRFPDPDDTSYLATIEVQPHTPTTPISRWRPPSRGAEPTGGPTVRGRWQEVTSR